MRCAIATIVAIGIGCSSPGRSPGMTAPAAASTDVRNVVRADAGGTDAATANDLRDACSIGTRAGCDELASRCDHDDSAACVALGNVYRSGGREPRDVAKARELFARVCKRTTGPFEGCLDLAEIDCHGEDASAKTAAVTTLENACTNKFAAACAYAGLIYTEGLCSMPYNEAAWQYGVELFQRACDLGLVGACTQLGSLYRAGHGVKKDDERGKRLLFDACRRGDTIACDYVKAP